MFDKIKNNPQLFFADRDCLSEEELIKYIESTVTVEDKHSIERHLIDCELCSDALEGILLIKNKAAIKSIIADVNKKIDEKSVPQQKNNVIPLYFKIAFAASIILLVGIGAFIRFYMSQDNQDIIVEKLTDPPNKELNNSTSSNSNINVPEEHDEEKNTASSTSDALKDSYTPNTTAPQKNESLPRTGQEQLAKRKNYANNSNKFTASSTLEKSSISTQPEETENIAMNPRKGENGAALKQNDSNEREKTSVAKDKFSLADNEDAIDKSINYKEKNTILDDYKKTTGGQSSSSATLTNRSHKVNDIIYTLPPALDDMSYDDISFKKGMEKYKEGKYKAATKEFEKAVGNNSVKFPAHFYAGVSYLEREKYSNAIVHFNSILNKKGSNFYENEAKWYKAIALVKKKDKKEAKKILEEIAEEKGEYSQKAKEVLNSLH